MESTSRAIKPEFVGVLRTEQRMKRATSKRLMSPRLIILLIQRCLRLMARELVTRLIVRWG